MAVSEDAAGPLAESVRADERGDLPRLHPWLPLLPGRDDHPPVRERTITGIGSMVEQGLKATGYEEVGLLSLSSVDHSEIGQLAEARRPLRGHQHGLSLPSTRVDAFNVTLANELSRNGRRSGLTFAPGRQRADPPRHQQDSVQGGPRPHGDDGAHANGWRQVKLCFMCVVCPPRPTRTSWRSPTSPSR